MSKKQNGKRVPGGRHSLCKDPEQVKASLFEEQKDWETKDPTGLLCLFGYIHAFGLYPGGHRRPGRNLNRD